MPERRLSPALVAAAAEIACVLEVRAPKPGNVGPGRERAGLAYLDFIVSAAILERTFRRGLARWRVGRLVHETIAGSRKQVGTNTHLGIVLLLAPIAKAALRREREPLRARLRRVLDDLDREDARRAYAAIRLARPGGLGRVPRQDVRRPPTVTLLEAMRLAAARDAVAREYATGFDATFGIGLPAIERARGRGARLVQATVIAFLEVLAAHPDTLVERRHGRSAARRLSRAAAQALAAGGPLRPEGRRLLERLDRRLRGAKPPINPGATADVVAASLFVWLLSGAESGEAWVPPRRAR
jgi:triphosphoribosyl-dephospho-CoA synthase